MFFASMSISSSIALFHFDDAFAVTMFVAKIELKCGVHNVDLVVAHLPEIS